MEIRKEYLTRGQAAEYCIKQGLPVSPKTLAKYACVGGGPKFRKFGRMRVVYKITDLDEWIEQRLSDTFAATNILCNDASSVQNKE